MQIGINADSGTINGNLAVLESMLRDFHAAGFSYVEIPVHGVDCVINGNVAMLHLAMLKQILGKFPFSYTVHAPDALNLADALQPEIHAAALQATIDFAAEIGARIVVYHGSWESNSHSARMAKKPAPEDSAAIQAYWAQEIDRLSRIAEYAEIRGVIVAVENIFQQRAHERTYRIDPSELAAVVSAVNSRYLGICFDFGHAFISANEKGFAIEDALLAVLPNLAHVHIHDNYGKSSAGFSRPIDMLFQGVGDLHLPPGWGSIPYSSLFPKFASSYQGVFMMEIQPRFKDFYLYAISWIEKMAGANPKELKELKELKEMKE